MQQKAWLILPVVICLSHWLSCSKKEFEVRFLPGPPNSPEPRRVQPTKKWPRKKKNGKLGKTTTTDRGGRGRRRPGSHGGGWSRRAELAARTGGLRAALARGRAADPGGPALLLSPGPAASQQDFDYNQPLIRKGPNDYILLRNGRKKLVRSLQGGEHRLTKLGKGFFRDKYYEYLVHVPVIIRGRRRSGRNAERRDWLPVNELGGAMTRHPAHLTEEQVAQRVRQQVEASLGDPAAPILQLSDETYTSLTLGTGWSAPRARSTGTPGAR